MKFPKKFTLLILTAFLTIQFFAQDAQDNPVNKLLIQGAEASDPLVRLGKAERIIELAPDLAEGYTLRGMAHLQLQRYEKTVADMSKALQIGISDRELLAAAYKMRGLANNQIGKYADAVFDLTKASELDDKDFRTFDQRAAAYRKLGKIKLAEADERKSKELQTANEFSALFDKANSDLDNGNYAEAVRGFTKAIEIAGDEKPAYSMYFLRGRAFYFMKDYDSALADYNKSISAKPDFFQTYTFRGEIFLAKRELDSALKDFNKALIIKSDDILALRRRGEVYYLKDDFDKAIADLSEVIKLDGKNPNAYKFRAKVYRKLGKIEEAEADERKAAALDLRITNG